jgi:hypothetical protein
MIIQDNIKVISTRSIVSEKIKELESNRETFTDRVDIIHKMQISLNNIYKNDNLNFMDSSDSKIFTDRINNSLLILEPEEINNLFKEKQSETDNQNNLSIKTVRTNMNNMKKNENFKILEKKLNKLNTDAHINKSFKKHDILVQNRNISVESKNEINFYIPSDIEVKSQYENFQNKNDIISQDIYLNTIQNNFENKNITKIETRRITSRSFPRKFPKTIFQKSVPFRSCSFIQNNKKIGPKISINTFDMNHSRDSVELELDLSEIEKMFDKENKTESKEELGFSQEQVISHKKKEFHQKNKVDEFNTSQSKFSIKINNSKNQFEIPARLDIIYTQTSNNHCSNSPKKKSCIPFICSGNHVKSNSKKRNSKSINTSMFSAGNNITHTKRSTNLSIKSMKLNDSLSKLRKRRNTINSNNEETVVNGDKESACRCLLF